LEDLIQNKDGGRKTSVEEAPLNLDHLTKGQLDVPRRTSELSSVPTVAICASSTLNAAVACLFLPLQLSCSSSLVLS
jgi:hypothetical protein